MYEHLFTWIIAFLFHLRIVITIIKKWRMVMKEEGEPVTHSSHVKRTKTILSWLFSRLHLCYSYLAGWFTLYSQLPLLSMFPFLTLPETDPGNRIWSRWVVANFGDAALWGRKSVSCLLSYSVGSQNRNLNISVLWKINR